MGLIGKLMGQLAYLKAEPESRTLAQLIAGSNEPRAVLSFLALPVGSGGQRVSPDTQSTGRRSED